MNQKLRKALCNAKYPPEMDLAERCWCKIAAEDKQNTRIKLWTFSLVGFISLIGLIPAFKILLSDLAQSGFYEYLSLVFSSSGSVVAYWRDFLLLLAESLPIISIIFALTLIFIFIISLKYAMKQIIKGQVSLSF